MKQLTLGEFDALPNDKPLDVRVDGLPPNFAYVMNWNQAFGDYKWPTVYIYGNSWNNDEEGIHYAVDKNPIYHKLPADYVSPRADAVPRYVEGE